MKKNMLDHIQDYLSYRRSLGYKLVTEEGLLRQFYRFTSKRGYIGPLKRSWVEEFAAEPSNVTTAWRAVRLRVLHDFACYWAAYDSRVEVPHHRIYPLGYRRVQPRIYTEEEILRLMAAARYGHADQGIPGETYATIIGLMACSGIRTGEVATLRKCDIDWDRGLLHIRQSKGRPLRLVPLHPTAITALGAFAELRDRCFGHSSSDHFFLTKFGDVMTTRTIRQTFHQIRVRSGISMPLRDRAPRLYDLRHTFACNCLLQWMRDGVDISRSMHTLATYLGHEALDETYWYLSGIPALLELVGNRFANYAASVFETGVSS
jgi:integrase